MTRTFLMTTTTIATLIVTPFAMASSDSSGDLVGNSPAITEGGDANAVGSTTTNTDVATKRPGIGISEFDPANTAVTAAQYDALKRSIGAEFKTQDGVVLGMVDGVTFDGQGNPEMIVDLMDDAKIDADTLVVTLLPEAMELVNGQIFLDTTADELYLKAQDGSKRDDETRTTVIIM